MKSRQCCRGQPRATATDGAALTALTTTKCAPPVEAALEATEGAVKDGGRRR